MKKLLFSAIAALAIANVVQAAESINFGVMKVPSNAKQTIVSVPWLASGAGEGDVRVADFVLTAGLSEGDKLYLYDDGKWQKSWQLTGGTWVGATMQTNDGAKQSGDDTTTIARGKAIMLVRDRENPGPFYIMGKPAASEAGHVDLPSGSKDKPAYALIAPAKTTASTLGSLTWTNLASMKDYVFIGMDMCSWNGKANAWRFNGKDASNKVIPLGEGVWFMSRGAGTGSEQKSVSWK